MSSASASAASTRPRTRGPGRCSASSNAYADCVNAGASFASVFASVNRTVTDAVAVRPPASVADTVNSQTPGPVSESSPPPT